MHTNTRAQVLLFSFNIGHFIIDLMDDLMHGLIDWLIDCEMATAGVWESIPNQESSNILALLIIIDTVKKGIRQ